MTALLDLLSWILLLGGGVLVLIGGVGVLRMPDLFTRIHAASLTESLGPVLILLALMLQAGVSLVTFKLAMVLLFLLITGPTATYALANAALLAGHHPLQDSDGKSDE